MIAIVHEVSGEPDADGAQRCVMCGKVLAGEPGDRMVVIGDAARHRYFPSGQVTELAGDGFFAISGVEPRAEEEIVGSTYIAGGTTGSPDTKHVPCTELVPT